MKETFTYRLGLAVGGAIPSPTILTKETTSAHNSSGYPRYETPSIKTNLRAWRSVVCGIYGKAGVSLKYVSYEIA